MRAHRMKQGGSGRWAESVTRKCGTFSMATDNSKSPTSCVFVYVFCGFVFPTRFILFPSPSLLLLSLPCCCINFHINSYSLWLIIGVVIVIAVVIVLPRPPLPHIAVCAALFIQNNLNRHYLCIQLAFSTQTPHVEHSNPNPRPNPQPNPHPKPNPSCHSPRPHVCLCNIYRFFRIRICFSFVF